MRISSILIASIGLTQVVLSQGTPDRGAEIYAQTANSVYKLLVKDEAGNIVGQGTGFLAEGGRIVTNEHVVKGGAVVIDMGAARLPASVERSDGLNDLAVLASEAELAAKPLNFSDRDPGPGEAVFVIGNPRGLERTISTGVLSGVREFGGRRLLQISAPISPGSSGGPVLNTDGEVIGIAVGILKDGQNLNFAVPASAARELLAGRGVTARNAQELIGQALLLRDKQSELQVSADQASDYQKLESQIKQLWQTAFEIGSADLEALDEIAIEAYWEHLEVAIAAAERAFVLASNIDRQIRLGILLRRRLPTLSDETELKNGLDRIESLLRTGLAAKKDPPAEALVAWAWTLEARASQAQALAVYQRAMQLGSIGENDRLEAIRGLVRVYYDLGRAPEGAKEFERLVSTGRATAWDWEQQAQRLSAAGNYSEAGRAYHQAARLGRAWVDWCRAASHLSVDGDPDEVLSVGRNCLETASGQNGSEVFMHWAHVQVGNVLRGRGLFEQALSHGREAAALQNDSYAGYELQADALFGLRRFQESINAAKRALRLSDGKYASTHFRLAAAYFEMEDWELARQSFEQAASMSPRDTAAPYNVALCLARLRLYRDAAKWYEEVLRRDPKHQDRDDILRQIRILRQ